MISHENCKFSSHDKHVLPFPAISHDFHLFFIGKGKRIKIMRVRFPCVVMKNYCVLTLEIP